MDAPEVPPPIQVLADDVMAQGGRAYLVGGGVRDHLLGHAVKDWDVEVFGLEPDALQQILKRRGAVNVVGRAFGVYKWRPRGGENIEEIDVSVPRRDSKVGPGHRGIAVQGDPEMSTEEAAQRRDLTINALMWDITDRSLADPAGGLADLRAGRLRAVDRTTFLEDPLRALRVVQFAARLQFEVDPELLALCRAASLDELPAERVQGEWGKLLLTGARPSMGFAVARSAEILERVFPEVAQLQADEALDRLAVSARSALPADGPRWALMLGGWLHAAPPAAVEATLDRLWMHSVGGYPVRERVLGLVSTWSRPMETDAEIRHASVAAPLRLAMAIGAAVRGEDPAPQLARAHALGVLDGPPKPLLQGRDLKRHGIPPGPHMGEILRAIYARQLDGTIRTPKEALSAALALPPAPRPDLT